MSRKFSEKKRSQETRQRRPVMLILSEGQNNQTEKNYFQSFNRPGSKYMVKVLSAGSTDPQNMMKELDKQWRVKKLSSEQGDRAYTVLDLDVSDYKARQLIESNQKLHHGEFIVSNPCFEVWLLNHFVYTTKQFYDSQSVKLEMKKYIPEYRENIALKPDLSGKLKTAMRNSDKQIEHGTSQGWKWPSADFSPRTDVGLIMEEII